MQDVDIKRAHEEIKNRGMEPPSPPPPVATSSGRGRPIKGNIGKFNRVGPPLGEGEGVIISIKMIKEHSFKLIVKVEFFLKTKFL